VPAAGDAVTPVVVHLPLRLVSEANARGHWSKGARRAAEQRNLVKMALYQRVAEFRAMLAHGYAGDDRLTVLITRIGKKTLDLDNLQRAGKAVRDGVADALGIDDADPRIEWRYDQSVGKQYGVRIELRKP
jgi:hypothetical protein